MARCLKNENLGRKVFYGSMIAEGIIAMIWAAAAIWYYQEYGTDEAKITDDAVVVENMTETKVAFVEGDYRNIKVTTPEDLIVAEAFLQHGEE